MAKASILDRKADEIRGSALHSEQPDLLPTITANGLLGSQKVKKAADAPIRRAGVGAERAGGGKQVGNALRVPAQVPSCQCQHVTFRTKLWSTGWRS